MFDGSSFIASHTVCFVQFHEQNFDQFKYQLHYVSVSLSIDTLFIANGIIDKIYYELLSLAAPLCLI